MRPQKPKWDVRENLFFHQMQLSQQKNMKKKSKFLNKSFPILSSNEIDLMEGYQSDQPSTNLE